MISIPKLLKSEHRYITKVVTGLVNEMHRVCTTTEPTSIVYIAIPFETFFTQYVSY
jgi:hypothetical protein